GFTARRPRAISGTERLKNQPFNHIAPSISRPTMTPNSRNAASLPPTVKDQARIRAGNRIGQDSWPTLDHISRAAGRVAMRTTPAFARPRGPPARQVLQLQYTARRV